MTLLYNSTSFLYIPEYKLIHIDQVSLAPPSLLSILPSLYPNFCETSCFEFHLHVQHFSVCLCVQALCSDRISIPVHTIAWLRCFSLQHSIMYTHALFSFFSICLIFKKYLIEKVEHFKVYHFDLAVIGKSGISFVASYQHPDRSMFEIVS